MCVLKDVEWGYQSQQYLYEFYQVCNYCINHVDSLYRAKMKRDAGPVLSLCANLQPLLLLILPSPNTLSKKQQQTRRRLCYFMAKSCTNRYVYMNDGSTDCVQCEAIVPSDLLTVNYHPTLQFPSAVSNIQCYRGSLANVRKWWSRQYIC